MTVLYFKADATNRITIFYIYFNIACTPLIPYIYISLTNSTTKAEKHVFELCLFCRIFKTSPKPHTKLWNGAHSYEPLNVSSMVCLNLTHKDVDLNIETSSCFKYVCFENVFFVFVLFFSFGKNVISICVWH